jgi:hypothetical protein
MLKRHREASAKERAEQLAAQISIIAVSIPHEAINAGILKSIVVWRENRKTKAQWNAERKRDVQMMKKAEGDGKGGGSGGGGGGLEGGKYGDLEYSDPHPYLRTYNYSAFREAIKGLHPKRSDFHAIRCIDFAGQLLGDERLMEMCSGLRRCPVTVLNMSYNQITDRGMEELAGSLRSMSRLEDLMLAGNNFSDKGVQYIFEHNTYSPTMRKIDLSCNVLGPKTAYFLGLMFSPERPSALESLFLGGRVGRRGWGNDFLRVLIEQLTRPNTRPIRRLSIPFAALSADGIHSLAAFVACTQSLEVLNITKNTLAEPASQNALRHALRVNRSLKEFYYRQSGLTKNQRDALLFAFQSRFEVTWHEKMDVALRTGRELHRCQELSYHIELALFNNWQAGKPLPWPALAPISALVEDLEADELGASPLVASSSQMKLVKAIVAVLASADAVEGFVRTIEARAADASRSLHEVQDSHGVEPSIPKACRNTDAACKLRKEKARARKLGVIGALEKFTGLKAGVNGGWQDTKEMLRAMEKKGKNKAGKKQAKKNKAGAINLNTLLMTLEDFRSASIEHADIEELHVANLYTARLDFEEERAQASYNAALALSVVTSLGRGAQQGRLLPSKRQESWMPAFASLGQAAAFTHFTFIIGPAEALRAQKSREAFERDQRRLAEAQAKAAKKKARFEAVGEDGQRRTGKRFYVMRGRELLTMNLGNLLSSMAVFNAGIDGADDKSVESHDTKESGHSVVEELPKMPISKVRRGAVQNLFAVQSASSNDESSSSTESGDDDDEDGEDGREYQREVTRFTVPKRELMRRLEQLEVEDLVDLEVTVRNARIMLARASRQLLVRRIPVQVVMPKTVGLNFIEGSVPFCVYVECEEERGEPLPSLQKIDTMRQSTALEARTSERRLAHRLEREIALD